MKRLLAFAFIAVALAGCEDKTPATSDQSGMSSFMVTTHNGRQIECVAWEGYQKGGLSCDWAPQ